MSPCWGSSSLAERQGAHSAFTLGGQGRAHAWPLGTGRRGATAPPWQPAPGCCAPPLLGTFLLVCKAGWILHLQSFSDVNYDPQAHITEERFPSPRSHQARIAARTPGHTLDKPGQFRRDLFCLLLNSKSGGRKRLLPAHQPWQPSIMVPLLEMEHSRLVPRHQRSPPLGHRSSRLQDAPLRAHTSLYPS